MRRSQEQGSHHCALAHPAYPPAPDLVKRDFAPETPDRPWVVDITCVRTWEGWLYLSFVLDTYSRRIVGWSMANNLRTELVLDAVSIAIYIRRPSPGLIPHLDRGSQYASVEFGGRLKEAGVLPSMGSVADAYDNSMAETKLSALKRELVHRHSWPNRQTAKTAVFEYFEGFYNTRRRHSALGHLSSSEYEAVRLRGAPYLKDKQSVETGQTQTQSCRCLRDTGPHLHRLLAVLTVTDLVYDEGSLITGRLHESHQPTLVRIRSVSLGPTRKVPGNQHIQSTQTSYFGRQSSIPVREKMSS